jgi:hypothetical protein
VEDDESSGVVRDMGADKQAAVGGLESAKLGRRRRGLCDRDIET